MRVDTRPRRKNAPRPAEKSAPGYLQWIRGRKCLAKNIDCGGKIEAAHVDYAGDKGMATKVSDRFAVPLCTAHHAKQHRMGWHSFEVAELEGYGGAALTAAGRFWRAWPGRIAWERKLKEAGR